MNGELDRLYSAYHQTLFQYLFYMVRNRIVAEELIQEVYVRALQSYRAFEGKSSEKTWLYSVAKHVAIDWIRSKDRGLTKSRRNRLTEDDNEVQLRELNFFPEEILTGNEELQQIYRALMECPLDLQQVIVLRYVQALSISETAEVLGWSELKVKLMQQRAVKVIKYFIDAQESQHSLKEVIE